MRRLATLFALLGCFLPTGAWAQAFVTSVPGLAWTGAPPAGAVLQNFSYNCAGGTTPCFPLVTIYDGANRATVNADGGLTVHPSGAPWATVPGPDPAVVTGTLTAQDVATICTPLGDNQTECTGTPTTGSVVSTQITAPGAMAVSGTISAGSFTSIGVTFEVSADNVRWFGRGLFLDSNPGPIWRNNIQGGEFMGFTPAGGVKFYRVRASTLVGSGTETITIAQGQGLNMQYTGNLPTAANGSQSAGSVSVQGGGPLALPIGTNAVQQAGLALAAPTAPGTPATTGLVPTFNCAGGCGGGSGGGGAITGPLGPSTAPAAAVSFTETGTPGAGITICSGAEGLKGWMSCLDGVLTTITNQITAGSDAANNSKTATAINVTPISCKGTVATGGTAINLPNLGTATIHGFNIKNDDTTHPTGGEPIWINFIGTAAPTPGDSFAIPAVTSSITMSGGNSYKTPDGFGSNHAVSAYAATAGHVISCYAW